MSLRSIAFQGAPGAFSEIAILQFFNAAVKTTGLELAEEVAEHVLQGRFDFGCLPVENSIAGNVDGHLDTIFNNKLQIVAEHYLHIQHCLLGLPGSTLKNITSAFSHPMAIGQCQRFLRQHQIKGHIDYDTAGACQRLLARNKQDEAVIASKRCAEIYGLTLLQQNIQDIPQNYTRFVIFQRPDLPRPEFSGLGKISLAFNVRHEPGALLRCLQAFAQHGINLTRLQSRPIPINPFAYLFHVDCLSHLTDLNMQSCLSELQQHAEQVLIYGQYSAAPVPKN